MPQMLWIFIAILIVLALIGAAAWLVRRFSGGTIGSSARGRMPRLAVIDAAAVDGRRRLVLVRRDNVEHLLMIGGPTDIVVEPNIVRNIPQRDQAAQRGPVGTELHPRAAPLPDAGSWAENESSRPDIFDFPELPIAPERSPRPAYADEGRRHAAPSAEHARGDELGRLVPTPLTHAEPLIRAEPLARPEPALRAEPLRHAGRSEPRMEPRISRPAEPPLRGPAAARAAEAPMSSADQNLAEMAKRLEAALRRPAGERAEAGPARSVAVDPMDRVGAPPVAPEAPRSTDTAAPRAAEPATGVSHPAAGPTPPSATPKPAFDNLEDEMASLLGRPKTPS